MSGIPNKNLNTGKAVLLDAASVTPLPNSQLINNYCIKFDPKFKNAIAKSAVRSEFWHKFTIIKEASCKKDYSKVYLLKLITEFVYPCELLPVYTCEKENKVVFLARNCKDAIVKLCEANLILPNPLEPFSPFPVTIVKDISSIYTVPVVNIEPNIIEVLGKRESHGLIDLSGFHEDKDLQEFCPLFQPKVFSYVLSLTSKLEKNDLKITKLILCNNDIRKLPNLDSFKDSHFTSIDLGHNQLEKIEDIVPLKDLPRLQWVRLEGNPLCTRFDSGTTYFLYVKSICKNLQTLDTKRLCEDGCYKKHRTFLCDAEGFDFADQFVEQYYIYFDEDGRQNMNWFYHEDAMFSFTHRSASKSYTQGHELLNIFNYQDRNLLANGKQDDKFLYIGRKAISQQFQQVIPPLHHNPYSFYTDLLQYSKTRAVISITGAFKDMKTHSRQLQAFGFTRTFVLTSKNGKEWLITNDLWHIYWPYLSQNKLPAWPRKRTLCNFPFPFGTSMDAETEALSKTFMSLTGMTYEKSKMYLAKKNWNLELALRIFIDEHINDEIPDEDFTFEREAVIDLRDDDEIDKDEVFLIQDDTLPSISTLLVSTPESTKTPLADEKPAINRKK